ncbi:unnamed protein product [Urochloa humidicola]
MIQEVEANWRGVYDCRVRDMVLDLIRDLSYKENLVTISNDDEGASPQNKVRRLALQNRMIKQTQQDDDMGMAQVRSLVVCQCDMRRWVLHPSFKLLCVLDLEGCEFGEGSRGLEHLGDLLHLRYLGLQNTFGISEFPEEIGKLKFLQTLDLEDSGIRVLPLGVCQLTQLLCLCGDDTCAPDGFLRKVISLEELRINIDNLEVESQRQFIKDLDNLSELRVLCIFTTLKQIVQLNWCFRGVSSVCG